MAGKKTVKVEKKVINKEAQDQSESVSEVPKSSKISEFFQHLIAYGGFDLSDGVITYWGDYSVFIPIDSFVELFHELEKDLGEKEAHDLFYWIGLLIGSNSTNLLGKRYGLDKSKFSTYINGATQDGLGYMTILEYKKDFSEGVVSGTNSSFAIEYKSKYGKTNTPVDFYLCGMLAGGTEPLVNKFYQVNETKCIAKGDDKCIYELKCIDKKPSFDFLKKLKIDDEEITKKTLSLILKRKTSFKILGKKDIVFGDGSFRLRGIKGINFMNYGKLVLDNILALKFKDKNLKYHQLLAKSSVNAIKDRIIGKDLNLILKEIEIFGYGKFNIRATVSNKILITNESSPYANDYLHIFGRSKEPVDYFITFLLQNIYELNGKKVIVKELKCRAKGDKECIFEISILNKP